MRLVSSMNRTVAAPSSYLVDDYSPSVAYSTQKIRGSATNVVRLRRTSDQAESDFSASDLTDGTATTWTGANSGHIVKWYNQGTGGSTYDLVQATAANQPKLIDVGTVILRNGIPSAYFDQGDFIEVSTTPLGQTDFSLFGVSSSFATNTIGTVFTSSNTTNVGARIYQDTRSIKRNLFITNTSGTGYAADMSTTRTTAQTLTLLSGFVDSSKGMSSFDNSATGATNTFTGTFSNTGIYLGRTGGATYLKGCISEFILFATDEITNRSAIETNINDRYTIY